MSLKEILQREKRETAVGKRTGEKQTWQRKGQQSHLDNFGFNIGLKILFFLKYQTISSMAKSEIYFALNWL